MKQLRVGSVVRHTPDAGLEAINFLKNQFDSLFYDERPYLIHEVDFLLLQLQSDTSRLVESVPDDATLAAVHLTALDLPEIVRPEQQPASTPEVR